MVISTEIRDDFKGDFRFPAKQHLKKARDFERLHQEASKFFSYSLLCFAQKNTLSYHRLGLSVSKKLGNAVERNRIKRILREAFRLHQHEIPPGYDFLWIGKRGQGFEFHEIEKQVQWLLRKIHRSSPQEKAQKEAENPLPLVEKEKAGKELQEEQLKP
jgi:ribonuclease P protein component